MGRLPDSGRLVAIKTKRLDCAMGFTHPVDNYNYFYEGEKATGLEERCGRSGCR